MTHPFFFYITQDGKGGEGGEGGRKKPRKKAANKAHNNSDDLSAAQKLANEQMRRVLEEDQYSANGSIVDTDSENE